MLLHMKVQVHYALQPVLNLGGQGHNKAVPKQL